MTIFYTILVTSVLLLLSHVNTPYLVGAQYKTMAKYKTTNDFNHYENTTLGIKIDYPFNWTVKYNQDENDRSVQFYDPEPIYPSTYFLEIKLYPFGGGSSLDHLTGELISYHKQDLNHFNLVDNVLTSVDNKSVYKTIFTYRSNNTDFKAMEFNVLLGENRYTISYIAEAKVYNKWLDIIQHMINSLKIHSPFLTNLVTDNNDLAVNPDIHIIYTVDYYNDRIYMINGADNRIRYYIPEINSPSGIAVDNFEYIAERPFAGILFVTNRQNNTVTVITPFIGIPFYRSMQVESEPLAIARYTITVPVESEPLDIDVNPITNRIYVANSGSNSVSVIDYSVSSGIASQATILDNVTVGVFPSHLSVNPITNRIYVANSGSNSVSVIDGSTNKVIYEIPVGKFPSNIAINPITNRIYVANSGSNDSDSNYISVINGSTNRISENITVGTSLYGGQQIAINPNINTVYVTDFYSDSLYAINGSTNRFLKNDSLTNPSSIGIDTDTNAVYVGKLKSIPTYIINGLTYKVIDDPTYWNEISVNVSGSKSSQIVCGRVYPEYNGTSFNIMYRKGEQINCRTEPERGFLFDQWKVDDKSVENSTELLTLIISNQTRLSATVKEVIPFWILIPIIIFGIVAITVHLLHWRIVLFRQKRLLRK